MFDLADNLETSYAPDDPRLIGLFRAALVPASALTLDGLALTLDGENLTLDT